MEELLWTQGRGAGKKEEGGSRLENFLSPRLFFFFFFFWVFQLLLGFLSSWVALVCREEGEENEECGCGCIEREEVGSPV